MTPERIAFAGDWHASTGWARRAIRYAADQGAQTIIHLGDYGYRFNQRFLHGVEKALEEAGLTLQFVDGNHECFPRLRSWPIGPDGRRQITPRVHHLPRGYRWQWGDVRFLAVGGAYSVDRCWRVLDESWWLDETISDADVETAVKGGPVDVLVAHDCPHGVPIPGLEVFAPLFPSIAIAEANEHRNLLRKVVDETRPRWVWHGHYHIPYQTIFDFGYGPVQVRGLNRDGTPGEPDTSPSLQENVVVVDLADLAKPTG